MNKTTNLYHVTVGRTLNPADRTEVQLALFAFQEVTP